jgi:hypothetical protein
MIRRRQRDDYDDDAFDERGIVKDQVLGVPLVLMDSPSRRPICSMTECCRS